MTYDPDTQLRLECLALAVRAPGDPLETARAFYDFAASASVSSSDSRATSESAAASVSAIVATTERPAGSLTDGAISGDSVASNTGCEKASSTTPDLSATTGTSSANTAGGLSDGIYIVSGGAWQRLHDGLPTVVKLPDGWTGA